MERPNAALYAKSADMLEFFTTLKVHAAAFAMNLGLALVVFAGFWLAALFLTQVGVRFVKRAGPDREDVVTLIAQVVRTALLTIGVITALGTAGINVSALVAGLGLTGFALGFAFRDALSNMLAGFMILLYRPFRRGDRIEVTTYAGEVLEINLRYTIIQNEQKRILIPNATLLTNPIVVHQKGDPAVETAKPDATSEGVGGQGF